MTDPKVPSIEFCLEALQALLDEIPASEKELNFESLVQKKETAQYVVDYFKAVINQETMSAKFNPRLCKPLPVIFYQE